MSGVEGLGWSVLPDTGAPLWAGELASSLDQVGLQVTAENVLEVAKVLADEANTLERRSRWLGFEAVVHECGADPVSKDAAREFTARLQALASSSVSYADVLRAAADRLWSAAIEYGYAEAEIRAEFSSTEARS